MSNEAVSTIFSLIEEPLMLCAEISTKLADILYEEMKLEKTDNVNIGQKFCFKIFESIHIVYFLFTVMIAF